MQKTDSIRAIIQYIENHLMLDVDPEGVAKRHFISPASCTGIFTHIPVILSKNISAGATFPMPVRKSNAPILRLLSLPMKAAVRHSRRFISSLKAL